ncbi:MAG: LysR family transcriptional regulator [Oscillospiraceae bacterium]|nr:LysR family transcriptional regulator [Oscillospiraceae bacterium]
MNTEQIECFLTVSDTLSFAAAAEMLNITQPAVTHRINALEAELNVKLFKRTTRNVELTREGMAFMNDARKIMETAKGAVKRLSNPEVEEIIEELRIGGQGLVLLPRLAKAAGKLLESHPNLHPRFTSIPHKALFKMLEDEKLDCIVSFSQMSKNRDLQYREIMQTDFVCICPNGHRIAENTTCFSKDMMGERLILTAPLAMPENVEDFYSHAVATIPLKKLYISDNIEETCALVGAGFGISVLPRVLAMEFDNLRAVRISDCESLSFGVFYKSIKGNRLLKEYISAVRDEALWT